MYYFVHYIEIVTYDEAGTVINRKTERGPYYAFNGGRDQAEKDLKNIELKPNQKAEIVKKMEGDSCFKLN